MLLAFGGICTALSLICLFLSGVITINTFYLLALASVFTGVMYIEGGFKYSVITFFSVAILAFLLPIDKMSFVCYLGFFGYYPVLKGVIEKIRKLSLEIVIKTIFFIVVSILGMWVLKNITGMPVSKVLPDFVVIFVCVLIFHIYDYAMSIFFSFYENRIRNMIKR